MVSVLSNDLNTLIYSTYMGGSGGAGLRSNAFGPDGSLNVAGGTGSQDLPTLNAWQKAQNGGHPSGGNMVLARFAPASRPAK